MTDQNVGSNVDAKAPRTMVGLAPAIGAYVIWGLMPVYLILVESVPAFEFVAWRIVWTLPICLLIVIFLKQGRGLLQALRNKKSLTVLVVSALLIGVNWFLYVWAIQAGEIYAASLGYYINPLLNVALGTVLLKEKLSRLQWVAIVFAAVGVAILVAGALATLWISLTLAFSFATYGLLRKQLVAGALQGLTIESAILWLPAVSVVLYYAQTPGGSSFGGDLWLSMAIMMGGIITAVPLLLFARALRQIDYSTIGFIQFLAPTIVFLLGLFVFDEQLKPAQLACFILIWIALILFVVDMWQRRPNLKVSRQYDPE